VNQKKNSLKTSIPNHDISKTHQKFVRKLRNILYYLFLNQIPIDQIYKNNPFPNKPFSSSKAKEFIDAVKIGDDIKVERMLRLEKNLIFEFDYLYQTGYHWAAKRGLLSTMKILFSFGKYANFLDLNLRTPLFLAVKNNHFDICNFLIENGANPNLASNENKKPIDIATDEDIKRILNVTKEKKKIWYNIKEILHYHRENKYEAKKEQKNTTEKIKEIEL